MAALSVLRVGYAGGAAAACVPVPGATPDQAGNCSSASPSPAARSKVARSKAARSRMLLDSSDEEEAQRDDGGRGGTACPAPGMRSQHDSGGERESPPAVLTASPGDEVSRATGSRRGILRRVIDSSSDEDIDTDSDHGADARVMTPPIRSNKAIVISDDSDTGEVSGSVAHDDDAGSGAESLDGFIVYSSEEEDMLSEAEEQESHESDDAWTPSPAVGDRAAASSPWKTPATATRSPLAPIVGTPNRCVLAGQPTPPVCKI